MASGLEFVSFLNDSLKSSASTYIKSKTDERAEAQKTVDALDKEINYRERLIARYSASGTSGKQAFGAYSQLFGKLSELQEKASEKIEADRIKLDRELAKIKKENQAFYTEANNLKPNVSSAYASIKKGGDTETIMESIKSRFRNDKISDKGSLVFYALLNESLESGELKDAPKKDELISRIRKETAILVKQKIDPTGSAGLPDSLDPSRQASLLVTPITDNFVKQVHNSPVLQKRYLGRVVTSSRDYSTTLNELHNLMFGGGAEGISKTQVAQQVVTTIGEQIPNTIEISPQGVVSFVEGATQQDKNEAVSLLNDAGIPPGTTIAQAGRALEVQSGRDDSSKIRSEINQLKQRREMAVENLARTPRLSTSKLALLDHPILRVPGFREAIGTVSGRRARTAAVGAETQVLGAQTQADTAGDIEFTSTSPVINVPSTFELSEDDMAAFTDEADARIMGDDQDDDEDLGPLVQRSTAGLTEGQRTPGMQFGPTVSTGVPVMPAVVRRIRGAVQGVTDAANSDDPVAIDAAQQNLVTIVQDFNRLPESIRSRFPQRFLAAMQEVDDAKAGPEMMQQQIERALQGIEDLPMSSETVVSYVSQVDLEDADSMASTADLLEFIDHPDSLGDDARPMEDRNRMVLGRLGADFKSSYASLISDSSMSDDQVGSLDDAVGAGLVDLRTIVGVARDRVSTDSLFDSPDMYGTYGELSRTGRATPRTPDIDPVDDDSDITIPDLIEPPVYNQLMTSASGLQSTGRRVPTTGIELRDTSAFRSGSLGSVDVQALGTDVPDMPQSREESFRAGGVDTVTNPPMATRTEPTRRNRTSSLASVASPDAATTPTPSVSRLRSIADLTGREKEAFDNALNALSGYARTPINIDGVEVQPGTKSGTQTDVVQGMEKLISDFRLDEESAKEIEKRVMPEKSEDDVGNPAPEKKSDEEIKALLQKYINEDAAVRSIEFKGPGPTVSDSAPMDEDDAVRSIEFKGPGPTVRPKYVRPVESDVITRTFSLEPVLNPASGKYMPHYGTDARAHEGDSIFSIADGVIARLDDDPGGSEGKAIFIDHPDGTRTRYFHGSGFPANLSVGQQVNAGDTIMYSGSTGINSEGKPTSGAAHLHFEVGKFIDGDFVKMDPEKVYPEIFGKMKYKKGAKQPTKPNQQDADVLKNNMNI
jgi:murein DD-endopeptidase MepM/ murein hydrolase activator NlpD